MHGDPARQRGIALVVVLWALVLLSVVATTLTVRTRIDAKAGRNEAGQAAARALAEAGISRAIMSLLDPVVERRWRADGTAYELKLSRGVATIRIEDEGGKIDANHAPPELLHALLASAGLPDGEAASLADAIIDWRDKDDAPRARGAEAPAYREAERAYRPTNAPFATTDELRLVLGMNEDLHARILPLVTVHSGQAGIDPRVAPRGVLDALPAMTDATVEAILAARAARTDIAPAAIDGLAQVMRFLARSPGQSFTIRSQARIDDGAVFLRVAVVQLTRDPARPYEILAWRGGR